MQLLSFALQDRSFMSPLLSALPCPRMFVMFSVFRNDRPPGCVRHRGLVGAVTLPVRRDRGSALPLHADVRPAGGPILQEGHQHLPLPRRRHHRRQW